MLDLERGLYQNCTYRDVLEHLAAYCLLDNDGFLRLEALGNKHTPPGIHGGFFFMPPGTHGGFLFDQ